jgi:hypothetical protein
MKPMSRFATTVLSVLSFLIIAAACSKDNDNPGDEYVTWNMSANNGGLSNPPDSLTMYRWSNETSVYGMSQSGDTYFELTFPGAQAAGTYTASSFLVRVNGNYYVPATTPVQVNVITYGTSGQYLIGTYSGTIKDSATSSNAVVTGTFRVKNQ